MYRQTGFIRSTQSRNRANNLTVKTSTYTCSCSWSGIGRMCHGRHCRKDDDW